MFEMAKARRKVLMQSNTAIKKQTNMSEYRDCRRITFINRIFIHRWAYSCDCNEPSR